MASGSGNSEPGSREIKDKGMCREPGACSMLSFQKHQSMPTSSDSYSTQYNGSFKTTLPYSLQRSNQGTTRGLQNSSNQSQGPMSS